MKAYRLLFLIGALIGLTLISLPAVESTPQTPKKPVSNEYAGTMVEDPYQWLEKDDDPEVKAWSNAQNQRTRQYLDKLPDRAAIERQLTEWYAKTSPSYFSLISRPGTLFAMKFQPPKQQPLLVTLTSTDDLKSEKVVLDPNVLDAKGTTAIDWFVPSLDGKHVAVSLSKGGSEDGRFTFTRLQRVRRCRTPSRTCNIPQQAAARLGTQTAPEFITRVFPGRVSDLKLI